MQCTMVATNCNRYEKALLWFINMLFQISTVVKLSKAFAQVEYKLREIKEDTMADVDSLVDGFDVLINSLNTVSFLKGIETIKLQELFLLYC